MMRSHSSVIPWIMIGGVFMMGLSTIVHTPYRVLYNPSDSAPRGWYAVTPVDHLKVGDLIVVELDDDTAALAAERQYLPQHVPLLKRIAAMAGQRVCVNHGDVIIDTFIAAQVHATDYKGRTLPRWSECRPLATDEIFLLSNTSDASFDSRYFGPVRLSQVIGIARPLLMK
jgi:conjugative transfer signal peptidase TraF